MNINGFELENSEKLERVIEGVVNRLGERSGGIGEEADDALKLAKYDAVGGLITLNGRKVKTGSFWDFKTRKMRPTPEVMLVMRDLEGNEVEIAANDVSPELLAKEMIDKKIRTKRIQTIKEREAKKADRKKVKAIDEDDEE